MYSILLSKGSYIGFSKPLAKALKSIEAALMLSEILDKIEYHQRTAKENSVRVPKYIFITAEKFTDNLLLSAYQQRKAIKILVEFGLIETKLCGIPAKLHFKIPSGFNASIEKCLQQVVKKIDNCELSNLTTNYKTKDKNINNFLQTEKIETPQTEKHESDYVDFNNLNGTQKPKLLGQIKGLLQKEFNMFTFDKNDTFKINQAIYKVKDNLTAYNKSNGIFISVLDENVLEAFKTSMVVFKGKFKDSTNWSIPLFASCLNVNDYIKIDDTAKLLSLASDEIKEKYYKIAARDGKEIANEILRKVLKHKI